LKSGRRLKSYRSFTDEPARRRAARTTAMGIQIALLPMMGLGFSLWFSDAIFAVAIGPFLIMIGDVDALEREDD
jgi:hypothetical protein